ncbi:MAG: DUF2490 domain-containing protein [Fibrobacterota bacterium]
MKHVVVAVAFLAAVVSAAETEVNISRVQAWPRISGAGSIGTQGFGWFALMGGRSNLAFSKEKNETEVDDHSQGFWRADLIAGPSWKKRLSPELTFSTKLLYRPWIENVDEVAGKRVFRNSFSNRYDLFHRPGGDFSFHYRLIGWLHVEEEDHGYDNEFYVRGLAGTDYKLSKRFSLFLEEEVFLKPTADDSDVDGSEVFAKNMVWTGVKYRISPQLLLRLQYVNTLTNKQDTDPLKISVMDHSINLHLHITPQK